MYAYNTCFIYISRPWTAVCLTCVNFQSSREYQTTPHIEKLCSHDANVVLTKSSYVITWEWDWVGISILLLCAFCMTWVNIAEYCKKMYHVHGLKKNTTKCNGNWQIYHDIYKGCDLNIDLSFYSSERTKNIHIRSEWSECSLSQLIHETKNIIFLCFPHGFSPFEIWLCFLILQWLDFSSIYQGMDTYIN